MNTNQKKLAPFIQNSVHPLRLKIQLPMRVLGYLPWSVKVGTGGQYGVGVNTANEYIIGSSLFFTLSDSEGKVVISRQ